MMLMFRWAEDLWSSQMCGALEMSSKQMAKLFVSFVTATERRLADWQLDGFPCLNTHSELIKLIPEAAQGAVNYKSWKQTF